MINLLGEITGPSARLLEEERLAAIAKAEREYQLRLPMAPLPHCAGQPRAFARDFIRAKRNLQEEVCP